MARADALLLPFLSKVNKAGNKRDPAEIARIIAEASKGSKFYILEQEKDESLTRRIAKLLEKVRAISLSTHFLASSSSALVHLLLNCGMRWV